MKQPMLRIASLVCLLVLATAVGCGGKSEPEVTPPAPEPVRQPEPEPEPREVVDERPFQEAKPEPKPKTADEIAIELQGRMQTVYFGFDASDLSGESRAKIQSNADLLKQNSQVNVVVEGHCDERGTLEYNLALGERRASAVRDYLSSLGVSGSRMTIRSYGEEKPAVDGKTESAFSRNRRAEFSLRGS